MKIRINIFIHDTRMSWNGKMRGRNKMKDPSVCQLDDKQADPLNKWNEDLHEELL
jgi:hypothetical protein